MSTVLQIGDWTLEEKRSFIGRFIAGMMRARSDLWHPTVVMLDEGHLWAPQQGVASSSEAVTHLATAGRKRGFSAIFATQRLSLINKDVLGQCENKFLGRVEQSADRRSVADLLGFAPRSSEAVDMQGFQPGEFYVVGPALSPIPARARLYRAHTQAPKPGSTVLPTATPAAIQRALAELAKASAAEERAATATQARAESNPDAIASAEKRGYERGHKDGYEAAWTEANRANVEARKVLARRYEQEIEDFRTSLWTEIECAGAFPRSYAQRAMSDGATEVADPSSAIPTETVVSGQSDSNLFADSKMAPSSRKIVNAIKAAYPIGITLVAAAKRAGLSSRSSAYSKYLAEAAASTEIVDRGGGRYVAISPPSGFSAPPGTAAFKAKLPRSYAAMLEAIETAAGEIVAKEEVADRAGVSRTSSGLGAGLRELVELELIEMVDGGYRLSPDFL
ncbi:hypothetical protein [Mesorhizobium sp. L-8-10]|uniref:hypothetical protein n=1 Tax=Mesorhizobium sp. L-8-10 TaxID=2744523 RepID=UPI001FD25A9E|nr:hypothetical protein [Mesorhizobium sp. L-8-10]